nr:MAG TPA: hypothetical protein [Bacteriophage sp.]
MGIQCKHKNLQINKGQYKAVIGHMKIKYLLYVFE